MMKRTVSLSDGTSLDVTDADWPELACSSFGALRGGAYLIARLGVRRHSDGRTLVCLEEQVGGKTTATGALLQNSPADVETAARALVEARDLPATMSDECIAQLH